MPKVISKEQRLSIKKCYLALKSAHSGQEVMDSTIQQSVSNIFNVHINSIRGILNEDDDKEFPSIGRPKKTQEVDDFIFRKDLQRQIWNYNLKNEHFSIDTLLTYAKEHLDYKGERTSLFNIIKSMGYKYKKVNGRKILCEQKHVVAAKITFLIKFLQFKSMHENIRFVFLDETWIYQNGSSVRRWTHESDMRGNPSKIKSEGKRFTVLHAGSNFGFLEGCDFILDSKNNDRDYHKTMTSEIFQNWVSNQLIPALSKLAGKFVIIMDNAPYHSVQLDKPPTSSSKKIDMQNWLVNNKIDFDRNLNKKQLWNLILPFRADRQRRYVIDELLKEHGHEVLRLPPYHCQYNPIEMAWAFCKNFYNKNISSHPYTRDRVFNLWTLALSKCTPEMWQNFYLHCERLIEEDWTKHMGNLPIDNIPPFIISLEESDSDPELSDDESNSFTEVMDVE